MGAAINLEAQLTDPAVSYSRTQAESRALSTFARRTPDHVRCGSQSARIARALEMLDDLICVGRIAHVRYDEGASERSLDTSRCNAAIATSTSSVVVNRPRLKRSELCAS